MLFALTEEWYMYMQALNDTETGTCLNNLTDNTDHNNGFLFHIDHSKCFVHDGILTRPLVIDFSACCLQ